MADIDIIQKNIPNSIIGGTITQHMLYVIGVFKNILMGKEGT